MRIFFFLNILLKGPFLQRLRIFQQLFIDEKSENSHQIYTVIEDLTFVKFSFCHQCLHDGHTIFVTLSPQLLNSISNFVIRPYGNLINYFDSWLRSSMKWLIPVHGMWRMLVIWMRVVANSLHHKYNDRNKYRKYT